MSCGKIHEGNKMQRANFHSLSKGGNVRLSAESCTVAKGLNCEFYWVIKGEGVAAGQLVV